MTPDCKKLWRKVILRGIGTAFFGWAAVSVSIILLSVYGFTPEKKPVMTTSALLQPLKFPENEQMLNAAAAQLARQGAALSKMEPATGAPTDKAPVSH